LENDRERELPQRGGACPVGNGAGIGDGLQGFGGKGADGIIGQLRLNAGDAATGIDMFDGKGRPGKQAAAAAGRDHPIQAGDLFAQFGRRGALARDDVRMVEGRNERVTVFGLQFGGDAFALRIGGFAKDDCGAVAFGGGALGGRGVARHDDGGAHSQQLTGERDGLRVVAGGKGDHAGFFLGAGQVGNGVEGASKLEGADALEVLAFAEDFRADHAVQCARGGDRREIRLSPQRLPCGLDEIEIQSKTAGFCRGICVAASSVLNERGMFTKKLKGLGLLAVFGVLGSLGSMAGGLPKVKLTSTFPALMLNNPTWMCQAPGDPGRVFLVEQQGRILVTKKGGDGREAVEFLNITNRRPFFDYEDGLLSIAFHPNFQSNHLCYIYYTLEGAASNSFYPFRSVLSELKIAANDTNKADLASERILMEIPGPFAQHKGGLAAFGPDGYMYLGLGDGGNGWDPYNASQNSSSLLGKMLRIDVNRREANPETNKPPLAYGIPPDNPWVKEPYFNGWGARKEVYAWGLRNPWRYSFDRATGELWVGDVGQDLWEEIDLVVKGGNYGWSAREGGHYFKPSPAGAQYTDPVIEYTHRPDLVKESKFPDHSIGMCVTGGYVYRGKKYPSLQGVYVYGDYALGTIWGFRWDENSKTVAEYGTLLEQPKNIASFAEDLDGELYVVGFDGHIYSISVKE